MCIRDRCYGESDFIPGLVIDIYREVAVIQIHALSLYPLRQLIAEVLDVYKRQGVDALDEMWSGYARPSKAGQVW